MRERSSALTFRGEGRAEAKGRGKGREQGVKAVGKSSGDGAVRTIGGK